MTITRTNQTTRAPYRLGPGQFREIPQLVRRGRRFGISESRVELWQKEGLIDFGISRSVWNRLESVIRPKEQALKRFLSLLNLYNANRYMYMDYTKEDLDGVSVTADELFASHYERLLINNKSLQLNVVEEQPLSFRIPSGMDRCKDRYILGWTEYDETVKITELVKAELKKAMEANLLCADLDFSERKKLDISWFWMPTVLGRAFDPERFFVGIKLDVNRRRRSRLGRHFWGVGWLDYIYYFDLENNKIFEVREPDDLQLLKMYINKDFFKASDHYLEVDCASIDEVKIYSCTRMDL